MAGAGRKTFVRGILSSSDVNSYLMDQAVMVFPSASARNTAIPSPSEGMVTYLADADTFQFHTGVSWTSLTAIELGSSTRTQQAGPVQPGGGVAVIDGTSVVINVSKASLVVVMLSGAVTSNTAPTLVGLGVRNVTTGGQKIPTTPVTIANVGHNHTMLVRSTIPAGTTTFAAVLGNYSAAGAGGAYVTADPLEMTVLMLRPGV